MDRQLIEVTRVAVVLVAMALLGSTIEAQAVSNIGVFLYPPWGVSYYALRPDMTADGQWIVFADYKSGGCGSSVNHRLSMIRVDGTGFRVVVDDDTLGDLHPTGLGTYVHELRISGDARWLTFRWPHYQSPFTCQGVPPTHTYLVDIEAGAVTEFFYNGLPAGDVSFTDDGSMMVFKGYDPVTDSYGYYTAAPDGSNATLFLDTSEWFGASGIVSGDGSTFTYFTINLPYPYPGDVFVYDFESSRTTQVNPFTIDNIISLSISYDGSRVLWSGSLHGGAGRIFGVFADGTGFHQVSPLNPGSSATLTRDGQLVFFVHYDGSALEIHRMAWDGSADQVIEGWETAGETAIEHLGVNADGSILALQGEVLPFTQPLAVWYADPPMITTYGHGAIGTTLTWDIGGEPGDAFLLSVAQRTSSGLLGTPLAHGLGLGGAGQGLLGLFDEVLVPGVISGPHNIGTLQMTLPDALAVWGPTELSFRATVFPSGGGAPQVTNTTRMTLGVPGPEPETSVMAGTAPANSRRPRASPPDPASSPIERLRQLALADIAIWWKLKQQGLTAAFGWEDAPDQPARTASPTDRRTRPKGATGNLKGP